jgi:hypothetical protein
VADGSLHFFVFGELFEFEVFFEQLGDAVVVFDEQEEVFELEQLAVFSVLGEGDDGHDVLQRVADACGAVVDDDERVEGAVRDALDVFDELPG